MVKVLKRKYGRYVPTRIEASSDEQAMKKIRDKLAYGKYKIVGKKSTNYYTFK